MLFPPMIWSPFIVFYDGNPYESTNVIHKTIRTIYTVFPLKQSLFYLGENQNFGRLSEL